MEGHFRTCIHVQTECPLIEKADDGALGDPASLYVRVVVPCDGVNSIVWSIGDAYWSEVQNPEVRASYQTWRLMSPVRWRAACGDCYQLQWGCDSRVRHWCNREPYNREP